MSNYPPPGPPGVAPGGERPPGPPTAPPPGYPPPAYGYPQGFMPPGMPPGYMPPGGPPPAGYPPPPSAPPYQPPPSSAAPAPAPSAPPPSVPVAEHLKGAKGAVDRTIEKDDDDNTNPLDIWGSETTYNMNPILHQNICSSDYFKQLCLTIKTHQQLVDEIYNEVQHLEPFTAGSQRMVSTAFCILFRAFTMRLTTKQLRSMLKHTDSPYIRCVALLYLRYACQPKNLWDWFEPIMDELETVRAGRMRDDEPISIGNYATRLLTEQNYYDTIFPRIPVPVFREIQARLLEKKTGIMRPKKEALFAKGDLVRAQWIEDGEWYDNARIDEVLDKDKFLVTFLDFGNQDECTTEMLRVKNKYGAKKKRADSSIDDHDDSKRSKGEDSGDLFAKVLEQERERAVSSGKDYARRPTSYKTALSLQVAHGTSRRRATDEHHGSWNSED